MAASRSCIVTGIRHRTTFHAPPATGIAGTGTVHPPSPRELRLASTPTVPPPNSTWPIRGANWRRRREVAVSSRTSILCHDCRCGRLPWDAFGMSDVRQADSGERRSGVRQACLGISRALPGKIRFDAPVQFGGAIVQRSDSCYRDGVETIWGSAMSFSPERRLQCAKATAIDHAIDLACTHGLSFASAYLRNQRLRNDTIARVLSGPRDQHRQHECASIPPELPYTSEAGDASETPVRQLSYSSRQKFGHLR